jgi:hypothetical protein
MPSKKVRYGYSVRPRFSPDSERFLVGKRGQRIVRGARKLTHAFQVKPDGRVKFLHGIKGDLIDQGAHGKIYLIKQSTLSRLGIKPNGRHFVLKVYRRGQRTDGITQYAGTFAVFNYLKKQRLKHVVLRGPPLFAAGHNFLVSSLVNKPTLWSVRTFFRRRSDPGEREMVEQLAKEGIVEKEYFPLDKVPGFVRSNKISREMVEQAYFELSDAIKAGSRVNYGSDTPVDFDLKTKNFFVYGVKRGKLVVSVFDQGTFSIPNVLGFLEQRK